MHAHARVHARQVRTVRTLLIIAETLQSRPARLSAVNKGRYLSEPHGRKKYCRHAGEGKSRVPMSGSTRHRVDADRDWQRALLD